MKALKNVFLFIFLLVTLLFTISAWSAERPQKVKNRDSESSNPARASQTSTPAILSIIPAQSEPGGKVVIFGSQFGDRPTLFLGTSEVQSRVTEGRQVEFNIPANLDPGLYALYIKRPDGAVTRVYNFTVLALRPVLSSLTPDTVSACALGEGRDVTLHGRNFSEQSQLFFDGAMFRSRFISDDSMHFNVPQVPGGIHQVMVKNGPDNASSAVSLTVDTRPEITQITTGSEYVNYYELIIEGKNFLRGSAIYVDGQKIGGGKDGEAIERDKLLYMDCNRLIYQRHPYSRVAKDFRVQVVNSGGEASQIVNVSAP